MIQLAWLDLTVDDADPVRDFYAAVAGWTPEPVSMGEYDDYAMTHDGQAVAGICHARGPNTGLPPVWLPYFEVSDLQESLETVRACGGTILHGPRAAGGGLRMAVVQDPSGAAAALVDRAAKE